MTRLKRQEALSSSPLSVGVEVGQSPLIPHETGQDFSYSGSPKGQGAIRCHPDDVHFSELYPSSPDLCQFRSLSQNSSSLSFNTCECPFYRQGNRQMLWKESLRFRQENGPAAW